MPIPDMAGDCQAIGTAERGIGMTGRGVVTSEGVERAVECEAVNRRSRALELLVLLMAGFRS
jgi:hypothetical protein